MFFTDKVKDMKESDLIGQMVQETIQNADDTEHNVLDFTHDVDRIIYLQFDSVRLCHIIKNKKKTLEIPQNWGPFRNRISSEIHIDEFEDRHEFLAVLRQFFDANFKSVKMVTAPVLSHTYERKTA